MRLRQPKLLALLYNVDIWRTFRRCAKLGHDADLSKNLDSIERRSQLWMSCGEGVMRWGYSRRVNSAGTP